MSETILTILSLGAGVQSSTLALMAAAGEVTPMPSAAVFADTGGEPADVYRWLTWLETQLHFPVHRVSKGVLADDARRVRMSKNGRLYTKHGVPAFVRNSTGKVAMLRRQCTSDHKLDPIYRAYNELRGRKRNVLVNQWVGISVDEAHRMKPARRPWVTNVYPLVERGISRQDCLKWMADRGHPVPPRSACVFCPYHNDDEWGRLKIEAPAEFAAAAAFETAYQKALAQTGVEGTPFLHRSCMPLVDVQFRLTPPREENLNLNFGNECEGMCGV